MRDSGRQDRHDPQGLPSLQAALEEAIREDPEDRAAHAAYADLLTEQGNPQGEFIQVQMALDEEGLPAAERKRALQRNEALPRNGPDCNETS